MESILVPLDGSEFAERALPLALGLALSSGARLRLVTVRGSGASEALPHVVTDNRFRMPLADTEEEYQHALAEHIRDTTGITVHGQLLTGSSVRTLSAFIRREQVDLVVMSTHGRGGPARAWLGSVADGLIRHVAVPVLLVPADGAPAAGPLQPAHIRRVLVALDGSRTAEAACAAARELCEREGAECTLLRVVAPPMHAISASLAHSARYLHEYIEAGRREAERYLAGIGDPSGRIVSRQVAVDHQPARAILQTADEVEADLIAVGTVGAGAIGRALVGSVADRVARGSTVPVLISQSAGRTATVRRIAAGIA